MEKKQDVGRLHGLDICRGFASLLVVVFHAALTLNKGSNAENQLQLDSFSWCARGVDIFFVLSGFVISLIHYHEWGNARRFRNYLARRLVRIYPTMWAIAIPYMLLYVFTRGHDSSESSWSVGNFVASLLLLPSIDPPIPSVLWTLKHELLFYFIAGLFFLNIRLATWLTCLWLACCVPFALVYYPSNFIIDFLFSCYNLQFGIGVLLGVLVANVSLRPRKVYMLIGAVVFAFQAYNFQPEVRTESWLINPTSLKDVVAFGVSSGFIVLGAASIKTSSENALFRSSLFLGIASYSIYLVHFPAIVIFSKVFGQQLQSVLPMPVSVTLLVLVGIIAGVLFHIVVERRILSFARRRLSGTRNPIVSS